MKRLLFILPLLACLIGRAQVPIGCPSCTTEIAGILKVDSLFLLPSRNDTLVTPGRPGAMVVAYGKTWLYTGTQWSVLVGAAWGSIPGNITSQTDLMALFGAKQDSLGNGYGWKKVAGKGVFDSALVRKVDTIYTVNDSTVGFKINGISYSLKIRGSVSGSVVASISMTAPTALFNSPVTWSNSAGAWTTALSLQNQNPNTGFFGPSLGSPGQPGFRSLVVADMPLNIPPANLVPSVVNFWNAKVDSTGLSNDSVYEWRNGSKFFRYFIVAGGSGSDSGIVAGPGIIVNRNTSTYRQLLADTFFVQSRLRGQKLTDSVLGVINAALALKVNNYGGAPGVLEDVLANRPISGSTGELFYATDTKVLYRWNGSAWDPITVLDNAITNAKLAQMPANTFKINPTGSTANAQDATLSTMLTAVGLDTMRANVWAAMAAKMTNGGSSASFKAGLASARPAASNCLCFYFSSDVPKLSYDNGSWIDLASGGGGGSDSGIVAGNGILVDRNSPTYRRVKADTFVVATRVSLKEMGDSLNAKVDTTNYRQSGYSATSTPVFNMSSSGNQTTVTWIPDRDSIDFHTVLSGDSVNVRYVQAHDTTSANALQSKYRSDTARTNLYGQITAKMTNYGNAPGQVQFNFASIPAATGYPTGTTLIVPDSGYHYVDTGSGGSRGWKKISGGSGSGSSVLPSNPTTKIGFSFVNGSASTFQRSDAASMFDTTLLNIHTDGFNAGIYKQIIDTASTSPNGYTTRQQLKKTSDSLTALIPIIVSVPNTTTFGIQVNSSNPGFFVEATGIPQPTSTYTLNGVITWNFITTGSHGVSFFDSVGPSPVYTTRLRVWYPPVKNVVNLMMNTDETTSGHMLVTGATVDLPDADFACYQPVADGVELRGNGTTSWVQGSGASITISTFSTADGYTSISINPQLGVIQNPTQWAISYIGPNGYTIDRTYSGLGSYSFKFRLMTPGGGYVTTAPTSLDHIIISSADVEFHPVNLQKYTTDNSYLVTAASTNFWLRGIFECWIVAEAISTSAIRVRWQNNYPSATSYKIYRDTHRDFSAQTLIYTGTLGQFDDTGLTSNTAYFYKMVAVVGGVDTYVSYFPCPTQF